jgi:hypothetical protein
MVRRLIVPVVVAVALLGASGCGLLPTDRPPTDNPYVVSYFPDDRQPAWHRLLFGTRWIAEGPPQ